MSTTTNKAYPLCWPAGWPRTQIPSRNPHFAARTVHAALEELQRQLGLMNATGLVVSSNASLGVTPKEKGVCVYFKLKGKDYALPCDKWDRLEDNLWALAKHIEALRGQERWGVGTIERAFAGYTALPSSQTINPAEWWTVLSVERSVNFVQAREAYKSKAMIWHPDRGGTAEQMALLNSAWEHAQRSFGQ